MFARLSVLACCLGLGLGVWVGWRVQPATRLVIFDVGQGDSILFQDEGAAILVDCGPRSDSFDAGERLVLPKLRSYGVSNVSLIVLTHPDQDHFGGLRAVLRRFPDAKLAISSAFRNDPKMLGVVQGAGLGVDQVLWLSADNRARVGAFELDIDCPPWQEGESDNEGSIFVRLSNGHAGAVLTGDAPMDAERRMLPDEDWRAQVLKAGHHGSKTSTCEEWLNAVKPKWAVISCGPDNRYGHPHRRVLDILAAHRVQIARTDKEGDVEFDLGPDGFERARRTR